MHLPKLFFLPGRATYKLPVEARVKDAMSDTQPNPDEKKNEHQYG
jgi:hypothetical protein